MNLPLSLCQFMKKGMFPVILRLGLRFYLIGKVGYLLSIDVKIEGDQE